MQLKPTHIYINWIGGDNDGDTLGMAAINKEQYEAGNFKLIDATLDDYYDTPRSSKDKKLVTLKALRKSRIQTFKIYCW